MKKLIMAVAILAGAQSAMAAVDWTPYLKGMQDNCNYDSKELWQALGYSVKKDKEKGWYYPTGKPQKTKIPKALQASVSSYSYTNRYETDKVTIKLKNAIAFGQPITHITRFMSNGEGGLIVTFANNNFTRLKPRFTMTYNGKKYPVGSNKYWDKDHKIDKNGWMGLINPDNPEYSGFHSLNFNTKNKSIECTYDDGV